METLSQIRNFPPGTPPSADEEELTRERELTLESLVRRHHHEREALQLESAAAISEMERVTAEAMRLEHHMQREQASKDWAKQRQELVLTRAHYAEIAKTAQRQHNETAVTRGLRSWQQILAKRDLQACSRCFHRMRRKLAIRATMRACKMPQGIAVGKGEEECITEEDAMGISGLYDKVKSLQAEKAKMANKIKQLEEMLLDDGD